MKDINTMEDLKAAIRELEDQDYVNQQFIKRRVEKIVDDLKPINILKNTARRLVQKSDKTSGLVGMITGGRGIWGMAAGLATSFVAKKLFKKYL